SQMRSRRSSSRRHSAPSAASGDVTPPRRGPFNMGELQGAAEIVALPPVELDDARGRDREGARWHAAVILDEILANERQRAALETHTDGGGVAERPVVEQRTSRARKTLVQRRCYRRDMSAI